jgi:hypothetical protein
MGYDTRFTGTLKFSAPITVQMLAKLNTMFGEDARKVSDLPDGDREYGYIDLVVSKDFSGIEWDSGTEKTYYLEKSVNVVLREMRKEWPEFGLTGQLMAQGEDMEGRWALVMEDDGMAHKRKVAITGQRVKCPDCGHKFILESAQG